MTSDGAAPLAPLRVIDLADDAGAFAGVLLADLGAEVIKAEPPEGAPSHQVGPFLEDGEGKGQSLFRLYYHGAKQAVQAAPDDRAELDRLLAGADLLLDDGSVGFLEAQGRTPESLLADFPALSIVSIRPYGRSGLRAHWRASDLTAWAAGGAMWLMGAPDRPPLWAAGQARHLTGMWAAVGALAAVRHSRATGRGQWIDLSQQEAVAAETGGGWLFAAYADQRITRLGTQTHFVCPCPISRCLDGYLQVMVVVRKQWAALARWLIEEGAAEGLDDPKYNEINVRMAERSRLNDIIARWTATRRKRDLFEEAQRRGIPFGVLQTVDEVAADPHLRERGFWRPAQVPGTGRTIQAPGPHYRFDEGIEEQ